MESKLTQLEELVESNKLKDIQIKSLNDEILELQGMCKKLENQNKHLEKNVQEEVKIYSLTSYFTRLFET